MATVGKWAYKAYVAGKAAGGVQGMRATGNPWPTVHAVGAGAVATACGVGLHNVVTLTRLQTNWVAAPWPTKGKACVTCAGKAQGHAVGTVPAPAKAKARKAKAAK